MTAAVIGAGAGGLAAARRLLERGIDVTVFELGTQVGGLWAYENDSGRSPAYASLHINSEARVTQFSDFPFPHGTPLFPSHRQVHAYLEAYAERFGVRPRIRFGTRVSAVAPAAGGGWTVQTGDGAGERFEAVVVATGHQAEPAHPPFAEAFAGEYLHAHAYRTAEPFRGRRVLVVGIGNSGLDIAADLAGVAARTLISVRSPVLVMPRMLFGIPTARVLARLEKPHVPWAVRRQFRELLSWVAYGRMERHGLTTPKTRTHPASSLTFMHEVAYGRVEVRPGVDGVDGRVVRFADGRADEVDVIVGATGYELDLPFLAADVAPVQGRRLRAYKRVVHPDRPGLYFVGFFNVSGGANIRMMDVQAEWVAALVAGQVRPPVPAAMHADIERERHVLAERYPGSPRYGMELDPFEYPREVAQELGRAA